MSHPSNPQSDRNLLFGILALQMNFMTRDDLVAGMNHWVLEKSKSLGQIMLEEKRLTPEQVQALDALIVQHLKAHGDDVERSLRAVTVTSTLASALTPIEDDDLQASISYVQAEPQRGTVSYRPPADGARYQKLRPHAGGGLGDVFVAEDIELHREVALKEIKAKYADDLGSRHRFVLEAEITGGLAHPGIVPVYGLGAYEDGRPYYAMRFIRGENLKEAIDAFHAADKARRDAGERSLAFRQLLRRFIDVCNAVAYAHSRKVLHRDLKPANVMLGKFGETLVIDWGLAKAGADSAPAADTLAAEPALVPASGSDLHETRAGVAFGTAEYMSPEQAAGRLDLLGPPSDIYSLGSSLYVLLTGQRPYRGETSAEILAKVQKGMFTAPIDAKPGTPPALDAICKKAMAFEPKDRYKTALEFAADIEHWLADEPVGAYPEPWMARVGRWARRHQKTVGGVMSSLAAVMVMAVLGVMAVSVEQRETEKQRLIAQENYVLAREQLFNSVEMIQAADIDFASDPALHVKRKDILKVATRACREYLMLEPDDKDMQKRAAVVYRFSANVHRLSDETATAEPLYGDSIRYYEQLKDEYPQDAIYIEKLAETLRDQSSFFVKLGRLKEAVANLERTMKLVAVLKATDPKRPGYHQIEATALMDLATIDYRMGKDADSQKRATAGVEIYRKLVELPTGRGHPYNPVLLAGSLNLVALHEREAGKFKDARTTHNAALKLLKDVSEQRASRVAPADLSNFQASCRLDQARTLAKLADSKLRDYAATKESAVGREWDGLALAHYKQKRADAETNLGGAAQQWDGLAKIYTWIPLYRERQAVALHARGQVRLEDKGPDAARPDFAAAQAILEKLVEAYPQVPGYRGNLGRAYAGLGQAARAKKQNEDAARWFGRAADALGKAVALSPDDVHLGKDLAELPK